MSEQTKALRLADILQHKIPSIQCLEEAAAELRRLDALNAELMEALEAALSDDQPYIEKCRAALAKAKEQT